MSKLLQLLTKARGPSGKRRVSPLIEFTHKRKKRRLTPLFFIAILSAIAIAGGLTVVILLPEPEQGPVEVKVAKLHTEDKQKEAPPLTHHRNIPVREEKQVSLMTVKPQEKKDLPSTKPRSPDLKREEPSETRPLDRLESDTSTQTIPVGSSGKGSQGTPPPKRNPDIKNRQSLRRYLYRIDEYERSGDIEEAIKTLKEALDLKPMDPKLLNKLASLYIRIDQCGKAEQYLERALEANPNYVNALINLSICEQKSGDTDTAETTLQRAFHLAPQNAYLNYNMGVFYEKKGDTEKAYRFYLRAAQLGEDSIEAFAKVAMARIELKRGNPMKVYELCREVVNSGTSPERARKEAERLLGLIK